MLLSGTLFGQEQAEKIDVKLYSNFDYNPKYMYHRPDSTYGTSDVEYNREINGFSFSPAIVFHNSKGNSHELELSRLSYKNSYIKKYYVKDSSENHIDIYSGELKAQFEVFLRYEYKILLFKKKDWKKLRPIIGFSATSFYHWEKEEPMMSSLFSESISSLGLSLSLVPRVRYNLNDRWYLDFNVPVSILTASYTTYKNEDHALSIENRKKSIIDFYNTPISLAVRFGIGFTI
jgi:hypothetical protein